MHWENGPLPLTQEVQVALPLWTWFPLAWTMYASACGLSSFVTSYATTSTGIAQLGGELRRIAEPYASLSLDLASWARMSIEAQACGGLAGKTESWPLLWELAALGGLSTASPWICGHLRESADFRSRHRWLAGFVDYFAAFQLELETLQEFAGICGKLRNFEKEQTASCQHALFCPTQALTQKSGWWKKKRDMFWKRKLFMRRYVQTA